MKQLVIIAGGFHPFHAGHLALYQSAEQAFPGADVKVAATNDTSARPFPFKLKEKLAQLAGVPAGKFYQVKSPFRADEITKSYDPADTQLIFVRSEKDADKPPVAGGIKKDGTPAYLQPISDDMAPMTQHAYMAYLPTVEFGPGMTSATEIRSAWPTLNPKRKTALVMSLYPATQSNPKLAATVVKMLDTAMGAEAQGVSEGSEQITEIRNSMYQYIKSVLPSWPDYVLKDWVYGLARGDHQAGVYFKPDADFDKWGFNKETILKMVKDSGLSPDTQWQLVPNMKFTLDMFDPKNKQKLIGRAGGHSDLGMGIPRDKERHATQAALAQQQGGIRKEPVILIKTPQGYELLEGWHRTIQHFAKYPNGYTGPAYVAVAQGQQGVAEGVPQPGESSGAPKKFSPDAKIETRQMTVKQIISSIPGVPYYNNVVDDWDAKDYSWGVTKKVIEYATYLKEHPESLSKLPPILVLNDKFEDGAHRVSAIWLLQQRMDPKNPLWADAKLKVQFIKQGMAESSDQAAVDALIKKHGWNMGRTVNGDLAFTWQGSKYVFYGERMRITLPDDRSISVVWGQKPDWQGRGTNELSFAQAVQKKLLTFDLPIWQALDRGQLTDSQAIQKFKAENERQAREAIAQGVNEASNQTNDSELNAIKTYAKRHYPNLAVDPESAFDKWVQRSLMHSNVDDHEMDQKIRRMAAEIAGLKTKIQSLKQQANDTADYLDESR